MKCFTFIVLCAIGFSAETISARGKTIAIDLQPRSLFVNVGALVHFSILAERLVPGPLSAVGAFDLTTQYPTGLLSFVNAGFGTFLGDTASSGLLTGTTLSGNRINTKAVS